MGGLRREQRRYASSISTAGNTKVGRSRKQQAEEETERRAAEKAAGKRRINSVDTQDAGAAWRLDKFAVCQPRGVPCRRKLRFPLAAGQIRVVNGNFSTRASPADVDLPLAGWVNRARSSWIWDE